MFALVLDLAGEAPTWALTCLLEALNYEVLFLLVAETAERIQARADPASGLLGEQPHAASVVL